MLVGRPTVRKKSISILELSSFSFMTIVSSTYSLLLDFSIVSNIIITTYNIININISLTNYNQITRLPIYNNNTRYV